MSIFGAFLEGAMSPQSNTKADNAYAMESSDTMLYIEAMEASDEIFSTMSEINTMQIQLEHGQGTTTLAASLESANSGVISKIGNAIKTLWSKTMGFLKNITRKIESVMKSNEKFISKYEDKLHELDLAGYKTKTFNYTNIESFGNNLTKDYANVIERIDNATELIKKSSDDSIEDIKAMFDTSVKITKGLLLGSSEPAKLEGNFSQEMAKVFRDGKDKPSEIPFDLDDAIKTLKSSAEFKKDSDIVVKVIDGAFGDLLKAYREIEREVSNLKADKDGNYKHGETDISSKQYSSYLQAANSLYKSTSARQALVNTAITAWRGAAFEKQSAAKRGIMGAFAYKNKQTDDK